MTGEEVTTACDHIAATNYYFGLAFLLTNICH